MVSLSAKYTSLKQDQEDTEDSKTSLHDFSSQLHFPRSRRVRSFSTGPGFLEYWPYLTHGILLCLCFIFLNLWINARKRLPVPDFPYSPSNAGVEYEKDFSVFMGSFRAPSIYRGHPSPELDAAWFNISSGATLLRLSEEEVYKIGKEVTPSIVKYAPSDGGGYMGAMSATHHLHCLNTLRKYLHFDHYGKVDPFFTETKEETYRTHLEHCIEMLRQVLTCSPDTTIITFDWVRGFSSPYPDFNTRHRCVDYKKLLKWHDVNGIPDTIRNSHIVRLDGEVDLPSPP